MQSTKTINALTKFLHKKTATELQLQQAEYLKKYCCSRLQDDVIQAFQQDKLQIKNHQ